MSKKLTKNERAEIKARVERDIAININLGYLKIVGETPDGKTLFALTEKGQQRVDSLMKSTKESTK